MREDLGDDDDDGGDEVEGVLGEGEGVDDDEGEYEGDEVDDDDDSIRNDGASREEDDEREETIRFSNGIREAEDLDLRHRFNEDLVFLGGLRNFLFRWCRRVVHKGVGCRLLRRRESCLLGRRLQRH